MLVIVAGLNEFYQGFDKIPSVDVPIQALDMDLNDIYDANYTVNVTAVNLLKNVTVYNKVHYIEGECTILLSAYKMAICKVNEVFRGLKLGTCTYCT